MEKDNTKGFYIMHKSVPPSLGLQYGVAGGDPGMSLEEAKEFILNHKDYKDFWVLDDNGKVVFSIDHDEPDETND